MSYKMIRHHWAGMAVEETLLLDFHRRRSSKVRRKTKNWRRCYSKAREYSFQSNTVDFLTNRCQEGTGLPLTVLFGSTPPPRLPLNRHVRDQQLDREGEDMGCGRKKTSSQ